MKNYILVITAVLIFIVLGAFFIYTFGNAQKDTNMKISDKMYCQSLCQSLLGKGYNFNNCEDIKKTLDSINYKKKCINITGPCIIKTKKSGSCIIK